MKKNIFKITGALMMLGLPLIIFAQEKKDLKYVVGIITDYIQVGIYLIISLAVVTFIWNIYRYFFTEKDKKEAGMYVLYSVTGFFIILSFWGLVAILKNSLSLPTDQPAWPFGGQSVNPRGGVPLNPVD